MDKQAEVTAVLAGLAILRAFRILEALGEFDEPPQLGGASRSP